jgi:hypothetical protein
LLLGGLPWPACENGMTCTAKSPEGACLSFHSGFGLSREPDDIIQYHDTFYNASATFSSPPNHHRRPCANEGLHLERDVISNRAREGVEQTGDLGVKSEATKGRHFIRIRRRLRRGGLSFLLSTGALAYCCHGKMSGDATWGEPMHVMGLGLPRLLDFGTDFGGQAGLWCDVCMCWRTDNVHVCTIKRCPDSAKPIEPCG